MYEQSTQHHPMTETQRATTDARFALLADAFTQIDTDKSGQLSRDELTAYRASHGNNIKTDEAIDMVLEHFDDVRKLFSNCDDSPNVDLKEIKASWFGRGFVAREQNDDSGISLGDLKAGRMSLTERRDYGRIEDRLLLRALAETPVFIAGMFLTGAAALAPEPASKALVVPFAAVTTAAFYDLASWMTTSPTVDLEYAIRERRATIDGWYRGFNTR